MLYLKNAELVTVYISEIEVRNPKGNKNTKKMYQNILEKDAKKEKKNCIHI